MTQYGCNETLYISDECVPGEIQCLEDDQHKGTLFECIVLAQSPNNTDQYIDYQLNTTSSPTKWVYLNSCSNGCIDNKCKSRDDCKFESEDNGDCKCSPYCPNYCKEDGSCVLW